MFNTNNLLTQKKGTRIRWQNRQAVFNGLGQGEAGGNGKAGDFAEGEIKLADIRRAKEKAHPIQFFWIFFTGRLKRSYGG